MSVNLLYVAFNRLAYTEATFQALLDNTDWTQVANLHIHDDRSTDGTQEHLEQAAERVPWNVPVHFESRKLRGPVAAMNRHLDLFAGDPEVGSFVKLDNDIVVPPGWLPELTRQATLHPGIDCIGMQPRHAPAQPAPFPGRSVSDDVPFIGGVGLIRYRMFRTCRPSPKGRFGWTEFAGRHAENRKAWISPDLPLFSLDLIDAEPWASLGRGYEARGWQRPWSKYAGGGREWCQWWLDQQEAIAA